MTDRSTIKSALMGFGIMADEIASELDSSGDLVAGLRRLALQVRNSPSGPALKIMQDRVGKLISAFATFEKALAKCPVAVLEGVDQKKQSEWLSEVRKFSAELKPVLSSLNSHVQDSKNFRSQDHKDSLVDTDLTMLSAELGRIELRMNALLADAKSLISDVQQMLAA